MCRIHSTLSAAGVLQESAIAENRELIDCIEVHNGRNVSDDFSTKQLEIANRYGIRHVIGSDAHTLIEIGRNYMVVKSVPNDRESFIQAVDGAEFVKAKCIPLSHKITVIVKLLKLAAGGDFHEIYRLIIHRIKKHMHK